MKRVAMLGMLAVLLLGTASARGTIAPTSLPETVECRFAHDLTQIPFRRDIKLAPTSTECKTTVYEYQGPEVQQDGSVCSFFVLRPVISWYHGNQLRNGVLRDGAHEYALLHDDSLPLTVCS